jgi:Protein of unknown function (DUF2934)
VFTMPRKRKNSEDQKEPTAGANHTADNGSTPQPRSKKKPTAPRKLKKIAAEQVDAAPPQISDDAIRTRAYFIAEERVRRGLPGNEESDWEEARRQLMAELA